MICKNCIHYQVCTRDEFKNDPEFFSIRCKFYFPADEFQQSIKAEKLFFNLLKALGSSESDIKELIHIIK